MEQWKTISGYPHYEVSNTGKVRSFYDRYSHKKDHIKINNIPRLLSPGCTNGYMYVSLRSDQGVSKSLSIHRLVATAFIPNPLHKPDVNHIDGNPQNNNVSNLEWVTESENLKHAIYVTKTASIPTHCKKVKCLETGHIFNSAKEAAQWAGLSPKNRGVEKCCRKEKHSHTAGGYHWVYV